jgi:glyoxylase-like metal-dependent hydrolase (beta-lactamase superfamily II)
VLRASDVIRLHMGHFTAPDHLPFAGAAVVVDAFLVRHPSGPVLLDTGIGVGLPDVETMYKPVRRPLDDVLRDAGVSVGDIRAVANCHMHFDHSGNNFRFPGVPILAQKVERDAVTTPNYTLAGRRSVRATGGRGRHRPRRPHRADARSCTGSSVLRDRHEGRADRHRRTGVPGRGDVCA